MKIFLEREVCQRGHSPRLRTTGLGGYLPGWQRKFGGRTSVLLQQGWVCGMVVGQLATCRHRQKTEISNWNWTVTLKSTPKTLSLSARADVKVPQSPSPNTHTHIHNSAPSWRPTGCRSLEHYTFQPQHCSDPEGHDHSYSGGDLVRQQRSEQRLHPPYWPGLCGCPLILTSATPRVRGGVSGQGPHSHDRVVWYTWNSQVGTPRHPQATPG